MNKIIFLDIDGVLNCTKTFEEKKEERLLLKRFLDDSIDCCVKQKMCDIDFEKVRLLKYITDITEAKIVVCSSWRNLKHYIFIEGKLVEMGLPIIGKTDYISNKRGEEIRTYLSNHKVDKFIILDDEVFPDFRELINYLVKTDFYNDGLNEEIVEEAIKVLGKRQIHDENRYI